MANRRGQKKISYTHWTGFASSTALAAGTVGANIGAAVHEPETLLRIRGNCMGYLDGPIGPGVFIQVAVGIIIVPEGTGTTVLWSPFTDDDAPWIWTEHFYLGYEEMVIDVVDVPGISSFRSVIDNKAMRIVRNQEFQVVFENTTAGVAGTANVAVTGRILSGK